jgi:hypothetical protein
MAFKLVEIASGKEVKPGMNVLDFRDEIWQLVKFDPPRTAASTGKVTVTQKGHKFDSTFYPSVFDLKIVEVPSE